MPQINHVQIFENRGAMMGASNPHPHCQIWATHSVPEIPGKELLGQTTISAITEVFAVRLPPTGGPAAGTPGLPEQGFVALVPFWAVWPFEMLICSRRHMGSSPKWTGEEVVCLAQIPAASDLHVRQSFRHPISLLDGISPIAHGRRPHPEWHFHAHFYPPLLRSRPYGNSWWDMKC